jgi:hypothetical protein
MASHIDSARDICEQAIKLLSWYYLSIFISHPKIFYTKFLSDTVFFNNIPFLNAIKLFL